MTNYGCFIHTGGHSTFFGLLNTFVHIVMYSYYLFSALGQKFHRYLWWKKYLTALQMVSVVVIVVALFFGNFVQTAKFTRNFVNFD